MSTNATPEPLPAEQEEFPMERIVQHGGDVILNVCPAGKPPRKLLVSSNFLSTASEVFAALLGPRFEEGQAARSETNPVTIALPEDEPQAMLEMCSLLHLRDRGIESLYNFGLVVDKYACAEALRMQAEHYLRRALRREWNVPAAEIVPYFVEAAAAAYLMDQDACFCEATWQLILNYGGPFLPLCGFDGQETHHMLPMNVIYAMEVKRNQLRALTGSGVSLLAMCVRCGVNRTNDALLRCVRGPHRFWPPLWDVDELSLQEELTRLANLTRREIGTDQRFHCPDCNRFPDVLARLQDQGPSFRNGVRLCCAKQECVDIADKMQCREHGMHPNVEDRRPF